MKLDSRTKSLVTLLCDEDTTISAQAMAELLAVESETESEKLTEILSELQEAQEPVIRKKVHQMQAIQRIRRRRRNFSRRLRSKSPNLLQGLGELHAIWYDDIDTRELSKLWSDIIKEAGKSRPVTPKRLAGAMKIARFGICDENIQDADLYCLGAIIEDRIGSDVILAAITLEIGRSFGLKGAIVRIDGVFGTMYTTTTKTENPTLNGSIIMPAKNWEIVPVPDDKKVEVWTTKQVLKYVAAMLFVNSVCSEGPRYIQILAACLADKNINESLEDLLPPPFGQALGKLET
jgi:hypothetical protein